MRSRKLIVFFIIGIIGLLLCAGNLWFTAGRSLMPTSLNALVVGKEIGLEKHPGSDDVYWLILKDGRKLHVDKRIYEQVERGEGLQKAAWSAELRHGRETLRLDWSADVRGMLPVMAAGIGIIVVMAVAILRQRRKSGFGM